MEYIIRLNFNDYGGLNYIKEEKKYLRKKEHIAILNLSKRGSIKSFGNEKSTSIFSRSFAMI
jgi:hypothetical protein